MIRRSLLSALLMVFSGAAAYAQVTVLATQGATNTSYTSLEEACDSISRGRHRGYVQVQLSANLVETDEARLDASLPGYAADSVHIYPTAPNVQVLLNGFGSAVVFVRYAHHVRINGALNGTGGPHNLTLELGSTFATDVVQLRSDEGAGLTADHVTIENCVLRGNSTTNIVSGIEADDPNETFDNLTVRNNRIFNCYYGIELDADDELLGDSLLVVGNQIGGPGATEGIGRAGIRCWDLAGTIQGNTVQYVSSSTNIDLSGIDVRLGDEYGGYSLRLDGNTIRHINSTYSTFGSGGTGVFGIYYSGGFGSADSILIVNNSISRLSHIASNNQLYNNDEVYGIRMLNGTGHVLAHNSIYLSDTIGAGTSSQDRSMSACIWLGNQARFDATVVNNALANFTNYPNTGTSAAVGILVEGPPTGSTFDHNIFYFPDTNTATMRYAFGASEAASPVGSVTLYDSLPDWQTYLGTGQALNSQPVGKGLAVPFPSRTDLVLGAGAISLQHDAGTPLALVPTDINGAARSTLTPDVGCSEFNGSTLDVFGPAFANYTVSPPDDTACLPTHRQLSVDVTDISGVDSVEVNWTINGIAQSPFLLTNTTGSTYTGTLPVAATNANDTIRWVLVATDSSAAANVSFSDTLQVIDAPFLTVLGADTTMCFNDPPLSLATQSVSPLPPSATVTWMPGSVVSHTFSFTPSSSGPNEVSVAVQANGCTYRDTLVVFVDSVPPPLQTADTFVCEPGSVTLSATGLVATGVAEWFPSQSGGPLLGSSPTLQVAVSTDTTLWVRHVDTSTTCIGDRFPVAVDLRTPPAAVITPLNGATDSLCPNDSLTLEPTPLNATTAYQWRYRDTTASSPQIAFAIPVSDTVFLTADDSFCTATDSFPVFTFMGAPIARILLPDTNVCEGADLQVLATAADTSGAGLAALAWSSGTDSAQLALSLAPTADTVLILEATDGCGRATRDTLTLTIDSLPRASLLNVGQNGQVVDFVDASRFADSVFIAFGDGSSRDQLFPNPFTHTYPTLGTYRVELQAFNACGSDTDTVTVDITVGRPDPHGGLALTLYPNPVSRTLHLRWATPTPLTVRLTDLTGRTHLVRHLPGPTAMLSLPNLPTGTYLLTATSPNGQAALHRLWKE